MFYFKITERSRRGDTKFSKNTFRECLTPEDVGGVVSSCVRDREVTSVSVTRISQAHFIRATRRGE